MRKSNRNRTACVSSRNHPRASLRAPASILPFIFHLSSFIFLLSSFIFHPSSFALAQTAAYAEISLPDATNFPNVTALLDVYDSSGQFVGGLKPSDAIAYEDGAPRHVLELAESPVAAQIVIAVNPGPALDVRDGEGITRYQRVQQALGAWAQARQSSTGVDAGDNLSLVTIAGPLIAQADPASWLSSFGAFQPNFRSTTPNIQSLALAVETAALPTAQVGMKRGILFITPHSDDPNLGTALGNIVQRAQSARIRISVWFVDADANFTHPSALLFQALAAQTGGGYANFNGLGSLPDPETYFAPLRRVYRLAYASSLTSGGSHTLSVEVALGGTRVVSAPQPFSLDIQPPNPILLAAPQQVTRQPPPEDQYNDELLVPTEQALEVVFDFPDKHPRPIVRTVLYVDDQAVAVNSAAPFDKFTWDLSAYTESGPHTLKVEATDSLGLTGASINTPVEIQVVRPKTGLLITLARYRYIIVWAVVGLAGLILVAILFGSRLRFRSRRERKAARRHLADPVTQPVDIAALEPPSQPKKTTRPRRLKSAVKPTDAPAWLVRLAADGEADPVPPIALTDPETTFGTDPVQAEFILDEPALSPLHARIRQAEAGYSIFDAGSVAGTWVNYEPVGREGHPLNHGDRVHFGNLMVRFELKNPPAVSEPTITPSDL